MKYREIVQFDPIETIIQLRTSEEREAAKELIQSYVISREMSDRLTNLVFPHLQLDIPGDTKGLLVVGNYGTGKSHLLSVISSVCEDKDLAAFLSDADVAERAKSVAGKFKVIRAELDAVTMPFRDYVCRQIEQHLAQWGVDFSFPHADETLSTKAAMESMMDAFHQFYPDQGLLFVVDELLDYLRSRKTQELIVDLGFLRVLGESASGLKFRFIAGVQEAIFDSNRFQFVAESLHRVKDRFQQIEIARSDVQFVVAQRLLRKTGDQLAWVREHLTPYARFYGNWAGKLDEIARLFPVHPDFISTFESIRMVEKREILRTLSDSMKDLLDKDIPETEPGLLSYDSYWEVLKNNPAFRSISDVRTVMDCSNVLESKIDQSFARAAYKPMAKRLIHGLSIHRLTTGDIHAPIGASAEELRDSLCLYEPMVAEMGDDEPEKTLKTHVETVMREIEKTVSGKFITRNSENGQYYLDVEKIQDVDQLIENKAETLGDAELDDYYYSVLSQVMECTDQQPYVSGYNIWQHELEWQGKMVSRTGYLFFGAPNERATAIPQRDFYVYFIQPYDPPRFSDSKQSDEVFFRLKKANDEDFKKQLQLFAAALSLAGEAAGQDKAVFNRKAEDYLRGLVKWLQKHMTESFEVTYLGKTQSLAGWARGKHVRQLSHLSGDETINFRDLINAVSGLCLVPHFEEQAPEYPAFSVLITGKNRPQAAREALMALAGQRWTKQATAVLDALGLADGKRLQPENSPYARYIKELMQNKGEGQVLNRSEVISEDHGLEYFVPDKFRLEEEWLVVLLAALVHSGDIELAIPGKKFGAMDLAQMAATPMNDLIGFRYLEKPKGWNIAGLKALFETIGMAPGMAVLVSQGKGEPVTEMQNKLDAAVKKMVLSQRLFSERVPFWGQDLLTSLTCQNPEDLLRGGKEFFESLQNFKTIGSLKNFRYQPEEVQDKGRVFDLLAELEDIQAFVQNYGPLSSWLISAEAVLPSEHEWRAQFKEARREILGKVTEGGIQAIRDQGHAVGETLRKLKKEYISAYLALHAKARLDHHTDQQKAALLKDPRLDTLNKLVGIDILNRQQLMDFREELAGLKSCFGLTEKDLDLSPICPHCRYKPSEERTHGQVSGKQVLAVLDDRLDRMLENWTNSLLDNLEDPMTQKNLSLLRERERELLQGFIDSRELPQPLDQDFVQALKEVLSGLVKVSMKAKDIRTALQQTGGPSTPEEIKRRFVDYVDQLTRGQEQAKIRIVVE